MSKRHHTKKGYLVKTEPAPTKSIELEVKEVVESEVDNFGMVTLRFVFTNKAFFKVTVKFGTQEYWYWKQLLQFRNDCMVVAVVCAQTIINIY